MSLTERSKVALFILGVVVSCLGFMADKARSLPKILAMISPAYVHANDALQFLDKGENVILPINHPGATVLLKWWQPQPPADLISKLSGIGRSVGVINVKTGEHRYELRLLSENNQQMATDFIWSDLEARRKINDILEASLFGWSSWLFIVGVLISSSAFFWDMRSK